jgi:lipoate-protein ligase A
MMWEVPNLGRAIWRLLDTGAHDGATNMAIDEAVLMAVAEGRSLPTLRFYTWTPPCVSVGCAQSLRREVDLEACRRKGYTWVRRPTGGRAVLHIDELTYSVIAPQGEPRVGGDILTSYQRLSLGLIAGLRRLGCDVTQAGQVPEAGRVTESAACFDVPSHYEVTALGRKLVGSAQARRRGVVLQHGALPLRGDVSRLVDVLAVSELARSTLRKTLRQRAVALDEVLGRPIDTAEVASALTTGFASALNLRLEPGHLSAFEEDAAADLRVRHASDEWTLGQ